jgi:hypothetical protein
VRINFLRAFPRLFSSALYFCNFRLGQQRYKSRNIEWNFYARHQWYCCVVKKAILEANPEITKPHGYGWRESDDQLVIEWMLLPPAPENVLQLIYCACKKSKCKKRVCFCRSHGLSCTDLCSCWSCQNSKRIGTMQKPNMIRQIRMQVQDFLILVK